MDVASQFNTLLKNVNSITNVISPQLTSALNFGEDIVGSFTKFFQAKNSNNPFNDTVDFFVELDGLLGKVDDAGIVKGWMQQFAAMPQKIIDEVLNKLGGEANFLLRTFSDTIGEVTRVQNYRDDSTIPNINLSNTVSDLIDTGMKLPSYIEEGLTQIGQLTSQFANKNLSGIVGEVANSAIAHGANLVADSLHLDRFGSIINDYLSQATSVFGDASGFVRQVLNYSPFAGSNVAAPVLELVEKAEGLALSLDSVGRDIIDLPQKAVSLLKLPKV